MAKASPREGSATPPLSRDAEPLDQIVGPLRQVGEGAFLDLAVFAEGLAQQHGGRGAPVGHAFDIHGYYDNYYNELWQVDISYTTWVRQTPRQSRQNTRLPMSYSVRRPGFRWKLGLAEELVRQCVAQGDLDRAEPVVEASLDVDAESRGPGVIVAWLEALVADGQGDRALRFLNEHAARLSASEAIGAAIVARRLRDSDTAARFFDVAGPTILDDPRALLESAQNKLWLAVQAYREGHARENRMLLEDARVLLKRLIGMDASRRRHAWAWRELGRARRWLGEPASAVDEAYAKAIELAPDEARFREERG